MTAAVRLWWWGEDEAPGLATWVARRALMHEERHEEAIETRLLRHDRVIPSLPAAAAAGNTPDLHFLWNGIYHIQHAWSGLIRPLDALLPTAEVRLLSGGPQSIFGGQTFRAAWYLIPVVWVANLEQLDRVGVDAPPSTWEELSDTCERLARAGVPAVVAGDGEGDLSVWWLTHVLTQALDRGADVALLALGERSWREAGHARAWLELRRFLEAGWLHQPTLGLTLWDAFARFSSGFGAFTLASGPMVAACRRQLGDAVRVFPAPRVDGGCLAGLPICDTQGFGIPAHASRPEAGAALLQTLLSIEAMDKLHTEIGLLPARPDWRGDHITDPEAARMWNWYRGGSTAPYVPNLLPLPLHFEVCAGVGQRVLAGDLDATEAGAEADRLCTAWREASPAAIPTFRAWVDEVALAEPSEYGKP